MKKYVINVPIYESVLFLTVGDKSVDVDDEAVLSVISDGSFRLKIRDSRKSANLLNSIVHETNHLTFFILDRAGMNLCLETTEAYAYLNGYLFEEIYKRL